MKVHQPRVLSEPSAPEAPFRPSEVSGPQHADGESSLARRPRRFTGAADEPRLVRAATGRAREGFRAALRACVSTSADAPNTQPSGTVCATSQRNITR